MTDKKTAQSTALVTVDDFEKRYPDENFNRLLPSTTIVENVQKFSKLTIEIVKIDPNPRNQEVFSLGKTKIGSEFVDKLAFTKTGLDKLSFAMGIEWESEKSGRTDDRSNRDYFEYMAVGNIIKSDGTKIEISATKAVHVQDAVDETHNKMTNDFTDGKLFKWQNKKQVKITDQDEFDTLVKRKCQDREIEVRKHGLALAESGAKNRLVRSLNLKPHYSAEELKNPFVVPRIDMNVEEVAADPVARAQIGENAGNAVRQVFGEPSTSMPHVQDASFEEIREDDDGRPSRREIFENDVRGMTTNERHGQMLTMIQEQDIKKPDSDEPMKISLSAWEKRSDEDQVANLLWAFDLKQPETVEDDDLPIG